MLVKEWTCPTNHVLAYGHRSSPTGHPSGQTTVLTDSVNT